MLAVNYRNGIKPLYAFVTACSIYILTSPIFLISCTIVNNPLSISRQWFTQWTFDAYYHKHNKYYHYKNYLVLFNNTIFINYLLKYLLSMQQYFKSIFINLLLENRLLRPPAILIHLLYFYHETRTFCSGSTELKEKAT